MKNEESIWQRVKGACRGGFAYLTAIKSNANYGRIGRSAPAISKGASLFFILHFSFLVSSCEVETHSNGNIDGNWHLVQIDTLDTAGTNDLSESRIFWAFQANMVQLRDIDRPDTIYITRFAKNDNTLILSDPHINDREKSDPKAELTPTLNHFGVNKTEERFSIEKLNGARMTLSSNILRLTFKKH